MKLGREGCREKRLGENRICFHGLRTGLLVLVKQTQMEDVWMNSLYKLLLFFQGRRSTLDQHSQDMMSHHLSLLSGVVVTQQRVIDELSHQLNQTTCITNGTFIWKVTNFKSKLTKAKSSEDLELQSAPFYTTRHGYRLGVSLFPGGNGSGEGTHLSIYIRVLPGEYDNILEWPFRLPIVFKLFDQCSDPDKRQSVVESFTPNPSWKQFQKPVKDADNSGFGYPKFVTLELLQNGGYIRDDCIFVRIKVDVSKFIEP